MVTWKCTDCIILILVILGATLLVGVGNTWLRGGRTERFGTATATTGEANYASDTSTGILDERCRLNQNVSVDTGLGMVRHPTDSHPGTCVVRGEVPGNGVCDTSNPVLWDPTYVSSVTNEMVDGNNECVIRMQPGLNDDDARAYGDALSINNVELSGSYIALKAERVKCSNDYATLSADLMTSQAQTAAANGNWQAQITSDAASMSAALQLLRDTSSQALATALATRGQADDTASAQAVLDARADEQGKAAAEVKDEQGKSAAALRAQQNLSDQAQQTALSNQAQDANNRMQGQAQALAQAQSAMQQAQNAQQQAQGQIDSLTQALQKAQAQIQGQAHGQYMMVLGEMPTDIQGIQGSDGDKSYVGAGNMDGCRNLCEQNSQCTWFNFDHGNGGCSLKTGLSMHGHGWPGNGWVTSAINVDRYARVSSM